MQTYRIRNKLTAEFADYHAIFAYIYGLKTSLMIIKLHTFRRTAHVRVIRVIIWGYAIIRLHRVCDRDILRTRRVFVHSNGGRTRPYGAILSSPVVISRLPGRAPRNEPSRCYDRRTRSMSSDTPDHGSLTRKLQRDRCARRQTYEDLLAK